jgi:para-nitrobenzyl esterase
MIGVFPGHHAFQPVIDGDTLLDTPIRSIAAGHGSSVPMIVGSNQDEGSLFAGPPMPELIPTTADAISTFLEQEHPESVAQVLTAYADQGRWGSRVAIGGDGMVTMAATALAQSVSAHALAYVYRFRWSNDVLVGMRLGTPHTLDVPFVFGTLEHFALTDLVADETAPAVSRAMQRAWLSFAAERKPELPSADWSSYTTGDRAVMVIDSTVALRRDLDTPQRESWEPW